MHEAWIVIGAPALTDDPQAGATLALALLGGGLLLGLGAVLLDIWRRGR